MLSCRKNENELYKGNVGRQGITRIESRREEGKNNQKIIK